MRGDGWDEGARKGSVEDPCIAWEEHAESRRSEGSERVGWVCGSVADEGGDGSTGLSLGWYARV